MLKGKKILITSGPTKVALDAVRSLTNHSTGAFGTLLAEQALKRGAKVTLLFGEGSKTPPKKKGLKTVSIVTHQDASTALKEALTSTLFDAVIHAMAVLDFEPDSFKRTKTKTKAGVWNLKLKPTPKIITHIKKWSPKSLLVGFKLEVGVSEHVLMERGRALAKKAGCDFVLANRLEAGSDQKQAGWLLDRSGICVAKGIGKKTLARLILNAIDHALGLSINC